MNLFDVTHGIESPGQNKPKPRVANEAEIEAYLRWLARCRGIYIPGDADFSQAGICSRSAGGYVLDMPGYDQRPTVTLETLDEAGEVIASQTLPVEPKKGGVVWTKETVHRAVGPVEKPAKAKRGKAGPAPIVETAPEKPVERVESIAAPQLCAEPVEALSAPEIAPEPAFDPVAALLARVEALEARIEALPVETVQVEAPTWVEPGPRRTAAHERAIRRAWAERSAARAARFMTNLRTDQHANAQRLAEYFRELAEGETERANREHRKRRRAVILARDLGKRLQAEHRLVDHANARRHKVEAELAKVREELDTARRSPKYYNERGAESVDLVGRSAYHASLAIERAERAETALAAMSARCQRQQAAIDDLAGRFEGMVSRVTRAEAAMRAAGVQAA